MLGGGFRVWTFGSGDSSFGFRFEDSGFRVKEGLGSPPPSGMHPHAHVVWELGLRGLGFGVWSWRLRVQGFGFHN